MNGSSMNGRPSVRIRPWRQTTAVTLAAGDLEATFLPSLGMLGTSLRYRGKEFLALPGGTRGYRAGATTGLPFLSPWANRLGGRRYRAAGVSVNLRGLELQTDENGLPIHGTMGADAVWEVIRLEARPSLATMRARFEHGEGWTLFRAFPFPHETTMDISVRESALSITTSVVPDGQLPVPVSFGFHPYLRLPRGARRSWRLRLPESRHVYLDAHGLPTGGEEEQRPEVAPLGDRVFDDLYALGEDRHLGIEANGLRLTVALEEGYPFAQVYAPAGANFVCLEPMTAATNALVEGRCPLVTEGEDFTARFSISIESEDSG